MHPICDLSKLDTGRMCEEAVHSNYILPLGLDVAVKPIQEEKKDEERSQEK